MPYIDPEYGDSRPGGRRRESPYDPLPPAEPPPSTPPAEPTTTPSSYPNGPWNDWPFPGDTTPVPAPTPAPTTPTPAPTAPTKAKDPFSELFELWYGTAPTPAQIASYTQQGSSWAGAVEQVLQNLYQMSPKYDPAKPWTAWRQTTTPTPAPTGTTTGTTNPQEYFNSLIQSKGLGGGYSAQGLASLEADLAAQGIKLQKDSAGNVRGRIYLSNGHAVDVVPPNGTGPWQWIDRGATGGESGGESGGGGTATGAGSGYSALPGGTTFGSGFTDPGTQQYEQLLSMRLNELFNPLSSEQRGPLDALLTQQRDVTTTQQSALEALLTQIRDQGPKEADALQALMTQQRDASKPSLDALLKFAQGRFESLQGPALTPQEQELMKTAIADPIQAEAAAQKQRALERTSGRGFLPTSGLAELDTRGIEQQAAGLQAEGNRALALDWLNRGEARQQEALQVGALIPELQSADLNDRVNAANQLLALEKQTQAGQVGAGQELLGIKTEAQAAQAAAGGQLLSLEQAFQQQEEARRNYGVELAQELANLPERRLLLASQINSGGSNQLPQLFQSIMSLAGMGQQGEQFDSAQSQQKWQAIMNAFALLWA